MSIVDSTKKFLVHCLTEVDNTTFDITRVALALGVLTFLALAVYHEISTGQFDMSNFGLGYGSLLGAGGAGVGIKSKMEGPAASPDSGEGQ